MSSLGRATSATTDEPTFSVSLSQKDTAVLPFGDRAALPEALGDATYMEIDSGSKAYPLVLSHVEKHTADRSSFALSVGRSKGGGGGCADGACYAPADKFANTSVTAGLGLFSFEHEGETLYALHQTVGAPVGTNCGAAQMRSLVLFVAGQGHELLLQSFCEELIAASELVQKNTFTVFRWHNDYEYWRKDCAVKARTMDSVVLPDDVKQKLLDDFEDFEDSLTEQFYSEHGIPYKRSYLFFGKPGTGKTSMINALAGRFSRNVCFLQPTHPKMTDDALKSAVQEAPKNSIVVLEDIDGVFTQREKQTQTSPLTFSGLLNALDGVGRADGTVFVMTSNHRERLDAALIRNGRVDLHLEFDVASREVMSKMWESFYPGSAIGTQFADELIAALPKDTSICAAGLQHFFVKQRKSTDAQALANIGTIVEDIQNRDVSEAAIKALEKGAAKEMTLGEFLAENKLGESEALSKFTELGAESVADVVDVEDGDAGALSLKPMQLRKLRKAAAVVLAAEKAAADEAAAEEDNSESDGEEPAGEQEEAAKSTSAAGANVHVHIHR